MQTSDFLCPERDKNAKKREFLLRRLKFNKSVWLCGETEDSTVKLLAQRKQNLLEHGKSSMPGNNEIQLKESFISHQIAGKISNSEVWHGLE